MATDQRYIMMVVPSLPEQGGGGIVQAIGYLCDAWARMDGVPPMRLLVTRGRGSTWLSPFYLLRALITIAVECGRGRVALVHVNVASRGSTWRKLAVVAMAGLFGVPVVMHLHGGGYRRYLASLPGLAVAMVRWMFHRAARTVVLGETWREFIEQAFQLPERKIAVIPNGVPDTKADLTGQDREMARLLYMGRLSRGKGIGELVAALSDDDLVKLEWSAVIAGDGELPKFRGHREQAGSMDKISLPGWLSPREAAEAYAAANIFVLPSHEEGLSIALLEAMAHGLAIVATPVGAHGEVIEDGKNGLLVRPGDPAALTAALRRVIDDADLRRRLGRAARARFEEKYQIARTAALFRATYQEAMA